MERPSYLSKYMFDWDSIEVVVSGRSALDSKTFLGPMSSIDQVYQFLNGYGLDPADPVNKAELFGNFHEALQFIKRYFLKEGNPDGLDLKVPNSLYMISDIGQLFLMATTDSEASDKKEERLWAEAILKVMHTIVHTDKDLRSNYFKIVQTQIFDRFYRHIFRDENNALFLGKNSSAAVPLIDFETKSKKTRDSIIIKLLHKAENVAEELFDRVGVRFITHTRFETLQVVKYLIENNIVIPHNNKPSRAINTMIDLIKFKEHHQKLVKMAIRNNLSEERFLNAMEREIRDCGQGGQSNVDNKFTSKTYQSIQFTCRQLIEYKNPFLAEFNELRKVAKNFNPEENDLARRVINMDVSLVARDIRFFYPYEIQIVDQDAYRENTQGEASHQEYKKQQVISAMNRIFKGMIEHKNLSVKK